MKLKEVIVENKINDFIKSFLPLAQDYLKIDKLPKILLVDTVPGTNGTTFGRYEPENNLIYLVAKGRHPKDTLRTLAHELVHYHQGVEHRLSIDSGETGSTEENEANAVAGILMRNFNERNPEELQEGGQVKPGSRPGSLRRKAGLKKGQTMSQADLLRLQGRATEMKRSSSKATRDRGIQLARQINWYKNFHKKKSEAVGYE